MLSRIERQIDSSFLYFDSTSNALSRYLKAGYSFFHRTRNSVNVDLTNALRPGSSHPLRDVDDVFTVARVPAAVQNSLLSLSTQEKYRFMSALSNCINHQETTAWADCVTQQRDLFTPSGVWSARERVWSILTEDMAHAIAESAYMFPENVPELTVPLVKDLRNVTRQSPTSLHPILSVRVHKQKMLTRFDEGELILSNGAILRTCGEDFKDFGNAKMGTKNGMRLTNYRTQMINKVRNSNSKQLFLEESGKNDVNFSFIVE
jgi:hypothetical protein